MQHGDEGPGSPIRGALLHQCLDQLLTHGRPVAGVLSRPPVGWEQAEDPALGGADDPGAGQPRIQPFPQVLAQRADQGGWFAALPGDDDLQSRVEDRVTGGSRVVDDDAARLAGVVPPL